MNAERWHQIENVLQEALDLPPNDRALYLKSACDGDEELFTETVSLIAAHDEAGDFIEMPAISQDAHVLAADLPDINIGKEMGAYRIVERVGSGGMGEVYLAHDSRLSRAVALKILPTYLILDESRLRRFQREARAVSALNHPNILTIHEVGEADGIHFIATEFIDGRTIRELISNDELSFAEILDVCLQVGAGLVAAHSAGIIHRDIKPENIMRRTDGLVKVLDFGIAKPLDQQDDGLEGNHRLTNTETGVVIGTVGYMSPEQARGLPVDERTDVWSLGVVLYEMVAKREPFARSTRMDTLVSILEHEPKPLSEFVVESDGPLRRLQTILDQSLSKEIDRRYQTVAEMLNELRSLEQDLAMSGRLDDKPSSLLTEGATTSGATAMPSRRGSLLAIAAVLVLVLTLFGIFLFKRPSNSTLSTTKTLKPYQAMNDAERLSFIAEQEQRISAMMGDRPVKLNDDALAAIKVHIDRYLARKERPGSEDLQVVYNRALPQVAVIARSFATRKVPAMIGIYLPMIESAYHPCSESQFGARGLFQFLPETAKQYGVRADEMCDVDKMAPAAADYIADRMAELGEDSQSMTLVLLSYNRGSTWVRNSLIQLRTEENFERNFWTLFTHRHKLDETFRNENAAYVPQFFAAAIIGENPTAFGLENPPLSSLAR
ncbi:MAG TPA: serine/threonine-protein kinase [Pyrinomonadaceae bacterium]|jgi:serine/threonine protein kinase